MAHLIHAFDVNIKCSIPFRFITFKNVSLGYISEIYFQKYYIDNISISNYALLYFKIPDEIIPCTIE